MTGGSLPTVATPCPLCGNADAAALFTTPDRAFAVPGAYTVARCTTCGFLYQRPRVRDEHLADCYPDHYPRHQEPSPRVPFTGSARRQRAARHALAGHFGYTRLADDGASWPMRLRAWRLASKLRWSCPPWRGQGRYLDVGCGSGGSLGVARALGWSTAGIEIDADAAAKARRYADELHVGDVRSAPFAPERFDVVTAFHVLEHVPDPVAVARLLLGWVAPGGLLIVEVPNAGGVGARLFGRAWSGLELPRHLSHFTPETLRRVIERARGHVVWEWHRSQPRHYLWSLRIWLRDRGWERTARATERGPVYGPLKLALELLLPVTSLARHGEVVRIGVVPAAR